MDKSSIKNYSWETTNTQLILEVLLDVRDLLDDIRNK